MKNEKPFWFVLLWSLAFWLLLLPKESAAKETVQYYMIGHAHIDPVWRWTKDEGYAEVFATFRSVLDRMKTYPEVAMVASSAQFYEWVLESDPQMFAEIQQRVREGRWNLVSGWWMEADVNCPGGESLVRQGLYGQTFFQKHFGRLATVGFGPDTFGHPWSLPQILSQQGLDSYFYLRPELNENPKLSKPIFEWQGQDGTRLLTFAILDAYNARENDLEKRCQYYDQRFAAGLPQVKRYALFYGVGNHGGGPTIAAIEKIKALQQDKLPSIRFSSLEQYVQAFRTEKIALSTINDELQHHARGCYSACSEVKLWNRAAEGSLIVAEKVSALNAFLFKCNYPADALRAAWKKVLFNQFHDILAGSSIEAAYQDSRNDYGFSQSIAREVLTTSLHRLAQQVGTADERFPKSSPFIVFNPCAWPVQASVELEMQRLDRQVTPVLRDADGNPVRYQRLNTAGVKVNSRIRIVFEADLPALGYHIYRLDFDASPLPTDAELLNASRNLLENEWVRVTLDTLAGTILSYYDKKANRELLAKPAGCGIVLNDWDDTWGHRIVSYDQEVGCFSAATVRVLESGPERARLSITSRYHASTLTQTFTLNRHRAELDGRVVLDWQEKAKVFQLSFPTVLQNGRLTYSIPYGFIERPMNGEEEPGQHWLDLSGQDQRGAFGIALINDFACGYNVKNGDLRITVLHSTAWSHHNPEVVFPEDPVRWMEQGLHTFNYRLMPHSGDWRSAEVSAKAQAYLEKPCVLATTNHPGEWPKKRSLLALPTTSAAVTAIKFSEDQTALIVRCVESTGKALETKLDIEPVGMTYPFKLESAEIKTLRLPLLPGQPVESVNLLEVP